jgi:hypothetical protein
MGCQIKIETSLILDVKVRWSAKKYTRASYMCKIKVPIVPSLTN